MGTLVDDVVYKINYEGSGGALVLPDSAYPTKIKCSDNLVSRSWRDMNGKFHDKPVNLEYKIVWEFEALSDEDIRTIIGYIRHHITNNHSRIFTITTPYPGYQKYYQTKVYLGTPLDFESVGAYSIRHKNGKPAYHKLELHWIETDGHVLL